MKRYIKFMPSIFLIFLFAGCAAPPYDPFIKSRAEIFESVEVVVLMPIGLADFEREEEVSTRYETLISERLEEAGFKVIPPSKFENTWNRMVEQLGGIYDPNTGKRDDEKLNAIQEHTINELKAKFEIDGYVSPRVEVVEASFRGNHASWDGTKEATTGGEGFWTSLLVSELSGTISALSLIVPISNINHEVYYVGRGGIQLFAHYKRGFVRIPKSEWFKNPARDEAAVNIAFRALLNPDPTQ